ncbi:hypothetical protein HMPREF9372_2484 [Sporosarcina newyorkensis 2681]|uniref:Uncharacterized protein n=1 Tax=Sporosarcina newyorkensis 2681 TaxID=1027292 RepID=F9DUK3_9BACL|nr:hypothetical protein HMPREF9372_2484 [Sporosarcina newyorkensis 2681]
MRGSFLYEKINKKRNKMGTSAVSCHKKIMNEKNKKEAYSRGKNAR